MKVEPPIRVAIVEDNAQVRDALSQILSNWPGFSCVCACTSAEEAVKRIPKLSPDVVLMDINLPGRSGVQCVRELKSTVPDIQIIMLTIESKRERVFESLEAGASGYLVKNVAPAKLLAAIEEIYAGGAPMSSDIARMLVQSFHSPSTTQHSESNLSNRENEVLKLVASGLRSREVGEKLGISLNTVNAHLRSIYEKLHVRSRVEAVSRYFEKRPFKSVHSTFRR